MKNITPFENNVRPESTSPLNNIDSDLRLSPLTAVDRLIDVVQSVGAGFRKDINGLRAVAVISVIFYHFGVPPFSGGYVGVDIFFVISGFLMSGIILSAIQQGRFSFRAFLWARFCRIFPALAAMCLLVLIFGWIYVEPLSYMRLAYGFASSILFVSNFQDYFNTSYFSPQAQSTWFLHTWSLSIEWQFYLIYPCILLLLDKYLDRSQQIRAMLVLTMLSFLSCVIISTLKTSFSFYMLPTRAWEMLLGGLVSINGKASHDILRGRTRQAEIAGIFFIVVSDTFYTSANTWPSFITLMPALGAALVIAGNRADLSLLKARAFQEIGKLSYSLYLWHWPVLVCLRYFGRADAEWAISLSLLSCVSLSVLSYKIVERPFQRKFKEFRKGPQLLSIGLTFAVAVFVTEFSYRSSGALFRSADILTVQDTIDARLGWNFPAAACEGFEASGDLKICHLGDSQLPGVLIIGDSTAQQWYPRLESIFAKNRNASLSFATRTGCPAIASVERVEPGHHCSKFAKAAFGLARAPDIEQVVFIVAWANYFSSETSSGSTAICDVGSMFCSALTDPKSKLAYLTINLKNEIVALVKAKKRVVVVLPMPEPGINLPEDQAKASFLSPQKRAETMLPLADYMSRNRDVRDALISAAQAGGATLVDPIEFICTKQGCPLTDENGRSLYIDAVHLRPQTVERRFSFLDSFLVPAPP